jgi:replicative DNA helicase
MVMSPFERLPPHDIEAEEAVVAALMVDPQAMVAVHGIVKPIDFFREKNGWIYEACVDLWGRDEVVNQITVAHELATKDRLEDVGGQAYLADTIRRLPTSLGVEFYARIVKRDSTIAA